MQNSFFEKLKKGMGIEIPSEEKKERGVKTRKTKMKKEKELEPGLKSIEPKVEESYSIPAPIEISGGKEAPEKEEEERPKVKEISEEEIEIKKPSFVKTMEGREETWLEPVGQLAVDVYQTEAELVIQSAIAGVRPEDLDISIEKDIVTISGERKKPFEEKGDYFSQECYWGKFSKQIILPVEIDPNKIEATLKDGILTIRAPKLFKEKKRKIMVRG